jgi:hypothetical protein
MIILIPLLIVSIILNVVLLFKKNYSEMLTGIIVGKYKGDKILGGYIVAEMEQKYRDENYLTKLRKVQKTYEVPEKYYEEKNIGDKGIFPY